ncbi:MAG: TonB-dependent receptor plug domain-containing protein [Candidatus Kapabacteria bacterium]|nr:TonB-dependent receptor plug domain-containing protein [Candidatus Kapabacteria bacterium]
MKLVFTQALIYMLIFFIPRLSFCFKLQDEIKGEKLLEMTLEELMNITVKTGNLTGLSLSNTPVSVTIISAHDISVTPARNIYDLLEIYVPGAFFDNHYDSPHIGIRGIIVDRNYKFLLLVNGQNMNMKAHNGATSELEIWDLGDIEKIEIIRGPGSVTYGPGAVAGIISITTKKSSGETGLNINANIINPYNSVGASVGLNQKIGENHFYLFGSIQKTGGYKNATIFGPIGYNKFDYQGSEAAPNLKPAPYYGDYNDLPQIKLFSELSFLKNWSLALRYTRQGASQNPLYPKMQPQIGFDSIGNPVYGYPVNLAQTQDQHISLNLKNETELGSQWNLSSLVCLSSEYFIRRMEYFRTFPKSLLPTWDSVLMYQDPNNPRTHLLDFSESSALGQFIFNKNFSDNLKLAAGTELSLNHWGPGWGKDKQGFRLGDNGDIISGTDSYFYSTQTFDAGVPLGSGFFVDNGWTTFTYSFLFELMWELNPRFSVLISSRTDKDSYSKWLFSPRIALISKLADNQILKFVVQQSQRMNTASQLLIQHLSGLETKPETLDGIELMYSGLLNENFSINSSVFYNNLDIISWYNIGRTSRPTGNLSLYGVELEAKAIFGNLDIAVNQSYVKQLKWNLADSVYFSGISYSDYYLSLNNLTFSSTGNELNNWSDWSTKLIVNYKLFDGKLNLHLDSRIFWNFEGEKQGLLMFEKAMDPANPDYQLMKDMLKIIKDKNTYGTDFRINMSVGYVLSENFKLSVFGMNLLGYGDNKRYVYDSGVKKPSNYIRNGFIEEPLTIGLKLEFK